MTSGDARGWTSVPGGAFTTDAERDAFERIAQSGSPAEALLDLIQELASARVHEMGRDSLQHIASVITYLVGEA